MRRWSGPAALICMSLLAACSSAPQSAEGENRSAAETNTALGRQYLARGQYEIALEKLKRAVAYDRRYAPAHTMLGVLYETIGQMEKAGESYRRAVQYDPEDGSVNNNYGAFLCARGQEAEAEAYFVKAVGDPFYETPEIAYANAGSCAMQRGDLDKAEAFLRQSLQYDDKLAAALLPMADLSFRRGQFLRARAFLQRYEAVAPMIQESLLLGYRIELKLGDEESANRYHDELRKRFPSAQRAGENAGREKE